MANYVIEAVNPKTRSYETKFGNMTSYQVKFKDLADAVEISKKDSSPAPAVGETLEGTISEGQYGKKFKKDYQPGGGPNFGGNGGSKSSYVPKDDKAIQAQWALGRSVEAYGPIGKDSVADYVGKVSELAVELFSAIDFVKGSNDPKPAEGDTVTNDVPAGDVVLNDIFPDTEVIEEEPWTA